MLAFLSFFIAFFCISSFKYFDYMFKYKGLDREMKVLSAS